MDRRSFLRVGSLSTVAASVIPTLVAQAQQPTALDAPLHHHVNAMPVTRNRAISSIHVLGQSLAHADQRLAKGLSDDVFARLVSAFRAEWPARSLRVVMVDRIGEAVVEGVIRDQWASSVKMRASFATDSPPYFNMERFRAVTDHWTCGPQIEPYYHDSDPSGFQRTHIKSIFGEVYGADVVVVGMPRIPSGLVWSAHYIDEETGIVMRAICAYEWECDDYLMRWDVVTG